MNILIYLEPQFEFGSPDHKLNWLQIWVPRIAASLQDAFGARLKLMVLTSDWIAERGPKIEGCEIVGFPQHEIMDLWGDGELDLRCKWFSEWPEREVSLAFGARLMPRMNGFAPDCILAFSSAGFFRHCFPQAALLHHEFGAFSRSPFPETWFFDPVGPGGFQWLDRFWSDHIGEWIANEEALASASKVMATYRDVVDIEGLWERQATDLKQGFTNSVLLPMQETGHALFNGLSACANPLQYAEAVARTVGPETRLIITDHPGGRGLNENARDYLQWKYPNIAFAMMQGSARLAPSQHVVPHVDAVLTVSSTVAALGLIWGKAIVPLAGRYMSVLASAPNGITLTGRTAQPERERVALMAFLLNRWLATESHIADPSWLGALVTTAVEQHRAGGKAHLPVFPIWRRPEAVGEFWIEAIESQVAPSLAGSFIEAVGREDWEKVRRLFAKAETLLARHLDPLTQASLQFHLAMARLNLFGDPRSAIQGFETASDLAARTVEQIGLHPDGYGLFWWGRFYALYAMKAAGDGELARQHASHFFDGIPDILKDPPPEIYTRLADDLGVTP